jgi:tRNA-intron endonuclease
LKTTIQKNYVLATGQEAIATLHDSGYFGRLKEDTLYLRFVEAAYLLSKNKIIIEQNKKELTFDEFTEFAALCEDFFELKYIVYKDLKERGYYVQSSATDFRVYPRGGHPGKTAAKSFVFVRSERMPISFSEIISQINNAQNVRKQFVLAVVDEESDITYYDVKRADAYSKLEGEMTESPQLENALHKAVLYKERVILSGKNVSSVLHDNAFFGKIMDEERILLSFVEALYLSDKEILKLYDMEEKEMTRDAFVEQASLVDPEFMKKYIIYHELKERGFVPKTGFKFGTHFRVYQKTEAGKIPHSEFLLHVISPDFEFKLPATSGAIRLANSVHKRMIYAADIGSKREYIEFERIKM